MHTIFLREHNRIASALTEINQHWNDETLFQETRHILIAIYQNIIYKEFLPLFLGKDVMELFQLNPLKNGYAYNYDNYLYPNIPLSSVAAGLRWHQLLKVPNLEDLIYRNSILYIDYCK